MLQEQRGDFVEIDHFSHCSPPYRRTEGIRHAVGKKKFSPPNGFTLIMVSL
jgi:hypothetical protein